MLQVGAQGRRWLVSASGDISQADALVPATLVDVRVDGPKLEALGSDGDLFAGDSLLGPLTLRTPAPHVHHVVAYRLGRTALLGVTETGALWRAPSATAPWVEGHLPIATGEHVISLATDRKGRVAVLLSPQRLLVSMDDGATFAPVPLLGIGAQSLTRDGNGDLWLDGVTRHARLDGAALVQGGNPAPLVAPKNAAPAPAASEFLAGERIGSFKITGEGKARKIALSLRAFDASPTEPQVLAEGASSWLTVNGYGNNVVIARQTQGEDEKVEVLQTSDDGRTLSPVGSLDGVPRSPRFLYDGPGGWTLIGSICKADGQCSPPQVRIGDAWQPLDKDVALTMGTWDDKNGRIYFWNHPSHKVQWLRTIGPDLGEISVDMKEEPMAMTVDDAGVLAIIHGAPAQITRIPPGLDPLPPTYLPFQPQSIAFAGNRGFAVSEKSGWETSDAGAHWMKVGGTVMSTWGQRAVECATWGCLGGAATRIGWDMPALTGELVASTDAPPKVDDADRVAPPPPAAAPVKLSCVVDDRRARITPGYSNVFAGSGDDRWHSLEYSKDGGQLTVGRAGAPPRSIATVVHQDARRGWTSRYWSSQSDRGAIAAYLSFGPKAADGSYSPVDADLTWYEAATGKVGHARIPRMKPFRVGRNSGASALIDIVEGGVMVLPSHDDAPLYFAHRDGKVEIVPAPPADIAEAFTSFVKVGNRIVLIADVGESYVLASTSDLGKTWTSTTWSLGANAELAVVSGAPVLLVRRGDHLLTILRLDTLGPELPPWKTSPPGYPDGLTACGPSTLADTSEASSVGGGVQVTVTSKSGKDALTLNNAFRYVRVNADGTQCTAVDVASGADQTQAIIAPHDLDHGYLLRADHGKTVWSQLSCVASP